MERDFLIPNRISATDIFKVAVLRSQIDKSQKNIAVLNAVLKQPCPIKSRQHIKKILEAEQVFLEASRQSLAEMQKRPEFINSLQNLNSFDLGTGKMRKSI